LSKGKIPPKPIIITFDDAYQNLVEILPPLLSRYQFKATVLVPVKHIGGANRWDQGNWPS